MKKIISFSLWGDNPKYWRGAIKNAELARQIYPDWEPRFYCGSRIGTDVTNWLYDANPLTKILISHDVGDWRGMFWRFEAASEADVMISRDCDSRLNLREKFAVDEWLASPKTFHIMRDHPWHGSKILGGMWGVKGPCQMIADLMERWPQEDRYQTDQDFLSAMIYPIASKDAMIHASFCRIEQDAKDFPSPRSGLEFVGQVFDENDLTVAEHQNMLMKALK